MSQERKTCLYHFSPSPSSAECRQIHPAQWTERKLTLDLKILSPEPGMKCYNMVPERYLMASNTCPVPMHQASESFSLKSRNCLPNPNSSPFLSTKNRLYILREWIRMFVQNLSIEYYYSLVQLNTKNYTIAPFPDHCQWKNIFTHTVARHPK